MPTNAFSNYPGGFPHGVTLRGVPILPTHAGNIWWVDSGHANASNSGANDGTINKPFSSIDYAVGRSTANNGDIIMVAPGHIETVTAAAGLDLDVAGITIWFLGNDNDRGYITFTTAASADMDVDAADITLVNPRFVAGIDALTGPIDVNAARFKMLGVIWEDGTTINTTDCVVADANADDMVIDGFLFRDGDAAGTQKQSLIQVAAATRPIIRNVRATGDFGTGIIENGTAWVDATLEDLVLDNASTTPTVCVLLQATSTGWARNCALRVASGTTGYTANNDMQFDNVNTTGTDAAEAGDPVVGGLADTAATGAVTTTDTLMAYIKQLVTQHGTALDTDTLGNILVGSTGIATYPSAAAPANGVALADVLRAIYNAVAADGTASATTVQTGIGRRVTKTGDIAADPDDLFAVTGKCLITLMVGEVTSVFATISSMSLNTSTNATVIAASTDVTTSAAGTLFLVSGKIGEGLNGQASGANRSVDAAVVTGDASCLPFIINDDNIYMNLNTTGTGLITWTVFYRPLEASASIASAA